MTGSATGEPRDDRQSPRRRGAAGNDGTVVPRAARTQREAKGAAGRRGARDDAEAPAARRVLELHGPPGAAVGRPAADLQRLP